MSQISGTATVKITIKNVAHIYKNMDAKLHWDQEVSYIFAMNYLLYPLKIKIMGQCLKTNGHWELQKRL